MPTSFRGRVRGGRKVETAQRTDANFHGVVQTSAALARAIYRWIVRSVVFPDDGSWNQNVALLFGVDAVTGSRVDAVTLNMHSQSSTGTWSERGGPLCHPHSLPP
jgi:hypothetical protein